MHQTITICNPQGVTTKYKVLEEVEDNPVPEFNIEAVRLIELEDDDLSVPEHEIMYALRVLATAIEHLNEGWKANWSDGTQAKYKIGYDTANESFDAIETYLWRDQLIPHCKSEAVADKIIELCEPELTTIFIK